MNTTFIKEITKAIKKTTKHYYNMPNPRNNGTHYLLLDQGLFLVMTYDDEEKSVIGKVAYNCSDLQCSYDFDWNMPTYIDGDVFFVEALLDGKHNRAMAKWFYKQAKHMISLRDQGLVVDWTF